LGERLLNGYWNKILRVDLSNGLIQNEKVRDSVFKRFLGGVGLAAKIILEEVTPDAKPLSSDNIIVFAVGPFQGTSVPGSGRWIVASKSPLTGIWADSCAGGNWGPEFKRTGFDAIVVKGKADRPVYLWIYDEEAEIKDASGIWGKTTSEATREINADLNEPKAKVACIGPAGERLVKFANVVNEHGVAGRCGLGAVLGSKNLKAIAVRGSRRIDVAKPNELLKKSKFLSRKIHDNTVDDMRKYGTTIATKEMHDKRGYGLTRNWREGTFDMIDKIDADHFFNITVSPVACTMCPIACHRHTKVGKHSKYAYEGYGPEYETIAMLGWLNGVSDAKAIGYMGHICDEYGMDTVTTGSMIGFAAECYEKGWFKKEDLDGIEIRWGDADLMINLINKISRREGLGDVLAEGIVKAAGYVGHEAQSIILHVKGLDYPAHDPRALYPLLINYATGTRGACHQRGFVPDGFGGEVIPEWGITEDYMERSRYDMKNAANIAIKYQDWAVIFNSLVQCEFMPFGGLSLTDQVEFLKYVTGWDVDLKYLAEVAERIFNLQRVIDVYWGISSRDDTAPLRCFEPVKEGKSKGKVPKPFKEPLMEYYKLRGWNNDGKPTAQKLVELGLVEAVKTLEVEANPSKTNNPK